MLSAANADGTMNPDSYARTPQEERDQSMLQAERLTAMVATLANRGENLDEIAHDARNMVTALHLYCDLLQEPGVLATPFASYGGELRLVADASRRLAEKLESMEPARPPAHAATGMDTVNTELWPAPAQGSKSRLWKSVFASPIRNLAEELFANRSLLAALAGPTIALTVDAQGGEVPVQMSSEDLTRILVNLVRNSAEAMSRVGRIHISLWESRGEDNTSWIVLNVEDNGPGLPENVLLKIFEQRESCALSPDPFAFGEGSLPHRGLGLSINRFIVEAAGGTIRAANRDPAGADVRIELPV
jgi:signal transduction histidine kinase